MLCTLTDDHGDKGRFYMLLQPGSGWKLILASLIAAFLLVSLPGISLADAGDHEWDYYTIIDRDSEKADYDYGTYDYVDSSDSYTNESDQFTNDKYYIGDDRSSITTDNNYLCSVVGDSHTANTYTQSILNQRFQEDYAFRSIDGITQVNYHDWSGQRTSAIADAVVNSGRYGAAEGADFVIIMCGTNNVDYDRWLSAEELADIMVNDYQRIIDSVLGDNYDVDVRPRIIVSGILPFLDSSLTEKAEYINDALRTRLDKYDVFTNANWYDLVESTQEYANPDLFRDNKHPNDLGAYIVAENWFEGVDALFDYRRIIDNPYIYRGPWYAYLGI
jgi:lysophospholipase L1-like esterase